MKPTGPWNRQTTPFLYSHHNAANIPIVKASASSSVKQPEVKTSRRVAGIKKIKDQTTFLQNCPEKWISRTDSTCLQHGKKNANFCTPTWQGTFTAYTIHSEPQKPGHNRWWVDVTTRNSVLRANLSVLHVIFSLKSCRFEFHGGSPGGSLRQ